MCSNGCVPFERERSATAEMNARCANARAPRSKWGCVKPMPRLTIAARKQKFEHGMTIWLRSNQYRVGLEDPPVDVKAQVSAFSKITEVAKSLAGVAMPMFASIGARDTGAVLQALAPFTEAVDLFGFSVKLGAPTLVPVIFADPLTLEKLTAQIEHLAELAKPLARLGLRLNGNPTGPSSLVPLCIYFNSDKHAAAVSALAPTSHRLISGGLFDYDKVLLDAGFVDVPTRTVSWPGTRPSRIGTAVVGFLKNFGAKWPVFDDADLNTVLLAAKL